MTDERIPGHSYLSHLAANQASVCKVASRSCLISDSVRTISSKFLCLFIGDRQETLLKEKATLSNIVKKMEQRHYQLTMAKCHIVALHSGIRLLKHRLFYNEVRMPELVI